MLWSVESMIFFRSTIQLELDTDTNYKLSIVTCHYDDGETPTAFDWYTIFVQGTTFMIRVYSWLIRGILIPPISPFHLLLRRFLAMKLPYRFSSAVVFAYVELALKVLHICIIIQKYTCMYFVHDFLRHVTLVGVSIINLLTN